MTNDDVAKINQIAINVANKFNDEKDSAVVIWDSHLALQCGYYDLCQAHPDIPEDVIDFEWRCKNPTHSGMVMYSHYAQMLVNYLCS